MLSFAAFSCLAAHSNSIMGRRIIQGANAILSGYS